MSCDEMRHCALYASQTASTSGAAQTSRAGGNDAFVSALSADGSTLVYSTYYGGSGDDVGNGIALTPDGLAVIAGTSKSNNLTTTAGVVQTTYIGGYNNPEAFVAKFTSTGALAFGTYLSGGYDSGSAVAVDA